MGGGYGGGDFYEGLFDFVVLIVVEDEVFMEFGVKIVVLNLVDFLLEVMDVKW